jgi:DUF4097 and DUF4098 domain-containing protein YvlB
MSTKQAQILQMVADKEITVEEALRRMREEDISEEAPSGEVREAVSQVLNQVGASLKEAGVAVNEVMTEVGDELRNNQDLQSVLGGLLSGIRTLGVSKTYEFEHEGHFSADSVSIKLRGANGGLTVQAWDKPGYLLKSRVGVRGQGDDASRESAGETYRVEHSPDSLSFETRDGVHGVSVSAVLYLPEGHSYGLDLHTSNGAIRAERLKGQRLVADSSNGSVTLDQCDFRLARIDTSNGAVSLNGSCGDVEVKTSNGSIRVDNAAEQATDSAYDLATSNGSITINLKKSSSAGHKVSASTSNGRVRADLHGLNVRTTGRNHLQAESDGYATATNKVMINARTSNGSVNITQV